MKGLAVALCALAGIAGAAQAADRFNLLCSGTTAVHDGDVLTKSLPWKTTYHVDLVSALFCVAACKSSETVDGWNDRQIVFAGPKNPHNNDFFSLVSVVNRVTVDLDMLMTMKLEKTRTIETKATCEPAVLTIDPKPKF